MEPLQDQLLREQDEKLRLLGGGIDKMRDVAVAISEEIPKHNAVLDEMDHELPGAQQRVARATDAARSVAETASTLSLWVVIVILLVLIFVVPFI